MGPYAPLGGHEKETPDPRALRLWVPFECGDVAGFFHCHEAHDGSVLDCEGRLHRAGKPPLRIDAVQHALRYESGTRRLAGGDLTLVDEEGTGHEYRFEVACPPAHPQGYGYTRGWSDGGQPGVFRGLDVIERDRFDVSDPALAAGALHLPPERRLGGTEFVSTIAGPGRGGGHGARRAHAVPAAAAATRRSCAGVSGFVRRHGLLQGQGLDLGPYSTRYAAGERTMLRVLADRAADRPDKDWVVFDSRDRLTFGGAWAEACRAGHAFDRDLSPGAHVGLLHAQPAGVPRLVLRHARARRDGGAAQRRLARPAAPRRDRAQRHRGDRRSRRARRAPRRPCPTSATCDS